MPDNFHRVGAIWRRHGAPFRDLFLPALEALTRQKNIDWIASVWFREQLGDMLSAMDS